MKELIFIGLGLFDNLGMTRWAAGSLKTCTHIYVEFYTSSLARDSLDKLKKELEVDIVELVREDVENHDRILEPFQDGGDAVVGFLTAGDPLTATTHQDIRVRAKEMGVKTTIIPGPSIVSAAPALVGLSIYKFGRITTIPFPEENYHPRSPYDVIKENKDRGCHSLVLLDIQADKGKYMTAREGLEYLIKLETEIKGRVMVPETLVVAAARVGSDAPAWRAGSIEQVLEADIGEPLHCLMIAGNLHFLEVEALVKLGGADEELLKDY